jgi:hypothetical protein
MHGSLLLEICWVGGGKKLSAKMENYKIEL